MLIPVKEPSQVGDARRRALAFAQELKFDDSRRGAVALAATEMATNLVKHAGSGYILLQPVRDNGNSALRVISVDKGPGIRDITKALSDGHSTAGTLGTGLGAIRRAASALNVYSSPGAGTVLLAEFWNGNTKHLSIGKDFDVGVVSEPVAGEEVCGDGWGVRELRDAALLMVVDGLGHGLPASDASREAERILEATKHNSLPDILKDTHDALRKTRGAAFGLARIDADRRLLSFVGVGNIATSIVTPGASRSVASHNGILGQNVERIQEFTVPWESNALVVMHSDGLTTRWDLGRYPGILSKHPAVIAAILHRDFCRGRDDVTVLVARLAGETNS
ncbi:MAG TPA: ATP-binding SpoIIE family protein phosphatase [Terriglobales bacterium]|jgi:anti-sigma regulatory factor (Ser/Thr protein kinase)|nr:ATP-binding SpoIIE family protein phosphatase [Terriglobales bacterium]